jgi:hypothetical protein
MSEGTTTLEPVMDQMPLICEMLNNNKKRRALGGISVFFLCRRTITTKQRARPLCFTLQLLCLSWKGNYTVSVSVLVPCSGQYFISFSTLRWYGLHQPVAIWRCVYSCNESQNLLHQIFHENKQINERFESYCIQQRCFNYSVCSYVESNLVEIWKLVRINPSNISYKLGRYTKFEFIPRSAHCKHKINMSIERRIF